VSFYLLKEVLTVKEIKLKVGDIWSCITAIIIGAMLCGTAVFVSIQYNKTQWDIVNTQAQAMKESANKINDGLSNIGRGICQAGVSQSVVCLGY
jgi:hypothetical protein